MPVKIIINWENGVLSMFLDNNIVYYYKSDNASLLYAEGRADKFLAKKPKKLFSIFAKCLGEPTKHINFNGEI